MKKLVSIAIILSMFGSVAFANGRIQATVVEMRESYKEVIKEVPENVCRTVEVPVYKEVVTGQGANGGDVLARSSCSNTRHQNDPPTFGRGTSCKKAP